MRKMIFGAAVSIVNYAITAYACGKVMKDGPSVKDLALVAVSGTAGMVWGAIATRGALEYCLGCVSEPERKEDEE